MVAKEKRTGRRRLRRPTVSIPRPLRRDITRFAGTVAKKYCQQFTAERELKDRVADLLRALLPPRRRRGRPRDPTITRAMMLLGNFRRKYPQEKRREIWNRVCLILISGYADLSEWEQREARENLQARVKSRVDLIRSRRKRQRKIHAKIPA
jgi:hypothetical protein